MVARVHDQPVGNKQQVEFAALGYTGDLLRHRQIEIARRRAVKAPAGRMVAGAEDKNPEMHLTGGSGHWRYSPVTR
jgi:hypothetical protein